MTEGALKGSARRVQAALAEAGFGFEVREFPASTRTAADAAGWDAERTRAEASAYVESVRRSYQIAAPGASLTAA